MSKIALTGNALGSGTLTLAAPNSNTDRTLTLPDEAGTVLTNTSGVAKTGDTMTGALTIQNAGFDSKITLQNTGTGGQTFNLFSTMNSFTQGGGNLMFHTSSAPNGILKMDASGRVTMPYQPAFHANFLGTGQVSSSTSSGVLVFDEVPLNIGGHYSTANGRFTAPVSGSYWFSVTWQHHAPDGTSGGFVDLYRNNVGYYRYRAETTNVAGYQTTTVSGIIYLNTNDYVTCFANRLSAMHAHYTAFSGFLVG